MAKKIVSTKQLTGTRVVGGKKGTRRIGKVRSFVFHPSEKKVVGFIVKRPDLLWMFRRKDLFVSIHGYEFVDGRIRVGQESTATNTGAYKDLGLEPEKCIMWIGLPLMTQDGESFGLVGDVEFNPRTGVVEGVKSHEGMAADALLGTRDVPADFIKGFRTGSGIALSSSDEQEGTSATPALGSILVSDEIKDLTTEGGAAEKLGKASAVAMDKASKTTAKVSKQASVAAKKTGKVVNKGAFATGKQIGKAKGMFSTFKEEYDKARHDD